MMISEFNIFVINLTSESVLLKTDKSILVIPPSDLQDTFPGPLADTFYIVDKIKQSWRADLLEIGSELTEPTSGKIICEIVRASE